MTATLISLLLAGLGMEILLLMLPAVMRGRAAETVVLLLLTGLFYIVCCFLVLRIPNAGADDRRLIWLILALAILFRVTVWPLSPALSDDVYRYRWEGKLQAHGGNPYQARPNDPEWTHLRDATFPLVVAKDFKAGYGPLTESIQHLTYRLVSSATDDPFRQVFWFKAPAALADLAILAVLWQLLAAHGLGGARLLIYAWSPLPVMEFWATGHNDAIAVLFVLLTLLAAARNRWVLSFTCVTLAAAAKLWPLLLLPVLVGWRNGRPLRPRQWLISLPVALLFALPYWSDVTENARFMSGFMGGWRNNDSLYGFLLWATGDPYHAKYLAFALAGAVVAWVTYRGLKLELAVLISITALLMLSANVHPWYLTWILPLLALIPHPALLTWTVLAPLSYEALLAWHALGEWNGVSPMRFAIYLPVYGLLIGRWMRKPVG
ncbi:MAG: hypothetical protein ACK5AZ_04460 [Bryobacteraceae bacterium]